VLERIIEQNKAIWKAIVKINNKLDNLAGVQKKLIREDNLGKKFWEVIILKFLWPLTSLFLKYFLYRLLHAKYVLSSQKKPCTRHQKSLKEL
jgi:hypothetical protein